VGEAFPNAVIRSRDTIAVFTSRSPSAVSSKTPPPTHLNRLKTLQHGSMASTTPSAPSHRRSASRTHLPSRPTTPLRPTSRSSFHDSAKRASRSDAAATPLDALEPAFAELSDGMADLEANFMHLQLMHESLARFSESFAAFLYGLNMNAFCVDFPEVRIALFLVEDALVWEDGSGH